VAAVAQHGSPCQRPTRHAAVRYRANHTVAPASSLTESSFDIVSDTLNQPLESRLAWATLVALMTLPILLRGTTVRLRMITCGCIPSRAVLRAAGYSMNFSDLDKANALRAASTCAVHASNLRKRLISL